MSMVESRREQMFPTIPAYQVEVARRFASGTPRTFGPGEALWRRGERGAPSFLLLTGEVIVTGSEHGAEIVRYGPGQMTGEISQLSGRAAITGAIAGAAGAVAIPFDAVHLRALLIGSAELGETLMRAFILRRSLLTAEGAAGTLLVGRPADPRLSVLEGFLTRNVHPVTVVDVSSSDIVERLGLTADDLPVAVTPAGEVLRRPDENALARAVGIMPELDAATLYDVAIVGAGPAGLAAATYAASEGLSVIVIEARAYGGQAGASARIENYLGFPSGITGQALMGRAFVQAQKFGVEIAAPLEVVGLDCGGGLLTPGSPLALRLACGATVRARSVIIASGARYRRPTIARLREFEGSGVSYWASPIEARECERREVVVVGGGNSAGQAAAFLAPKVARLHLVIRGDDLGTSMSRYLVDRIASLPNIDLHLRTEVAALSGDAMAGLTGATLVRRDTGQSRVMSIAHLFLFVGADPNTGWLDGCGVEMDARGFVLTGDGITGGGFETSVPRVLAIGDARSGSTKRVGAAIGEGASVASALHEVLRRH